MRQDPDHRSKSTISDCLATSNIKFYILRILAPPPPPLHRPNRNPELRILLRVARVLCFSEIEIAYLNRPFLLSPVCGCPCCVSVSGSCVCVCGCVCLIIVAANGNKMCFCCCRPPKHLTALRICFYKFYCRVLPQDLPLGLLCRKLTRRIWPKLSNYRKVHGENRLGGNNEGLEPPCDDLKFEFLILVAPIAISRILPWPPPAAPPKKRLETFLI